MKTKTDEQLLEDVRTLISTKIMTAEHRVKSCHQWIDIVTDDDVTLEDLLKLADYFGTQDIRVAGEYEDIGRFTYSQARITIVGATKNT